MSAVDLLQELVPVETLAAVRTLVLAHQEPDPLVFVEQAVDGSTTVILARRREAIDTLSTLHPCCSHLFQDASEPAGAGASWVVAFRVTDGACVAFRMRVVPVGIGGDA